MTPSVDLVVARGAGRDLVRRLSLARGASVAGTQAAQLALVYQVCADTRSAAWIIAHRVTRRDGETEEDVHLTGTEWLILEALVRHPGRLVSRRQLLTSI